MKKIGIFCAEIDATKVIEDSDDFLVMPAIIAREGVYRYPEGRAYKPADELRDAVWTADGAWIVAHKHPDTMLVMNRDDIKGQVENPEFSEDINGVRADLRFFKKLNSPLFLADVKTGKRRDVSIGFIYDYDPTPGDFNGERYDFVQRKFLIDHVAAGVPLGRCTSPFCGIAVDAVAQSVELDRACKIALDTLMQRIAVDPEETEDYIHIPVRDSDVFAQESFRTVVISEERGIKAVIGKLKSDPEGSTHTQKYLFDKSKGWTIEKAQAWIREHKEATDQEEGGRGIEVQGDAQDAIERFDKTVRLYESWSQSGRIASR